jgi:hypothetical protein
VPRQITDVVDVVCREREEIAREARSREADAEAHVELVRLKHQQLLSLHEAQKKTGIEMKQAHDEMKVCMSGGFGKNLLPCTFWTIKTFIQVPAPCAACMHAPSSL